MLKKPAPDPVLPYAGRGKIAAPSCPHLLRRPRPAHLQDGRDEQGGGPAHPRAREGAGGGQGGAGRPAALPVGPRAAERGAGRPLRPAGGGAPAAGRRASCSARPSAPGGRGLEAALFLSVPGRAARRVSPRRARPRTKVYRLALAVVHAAEDGRGPEALLGRYLEAWLLRCTASTRPSTAARPAAAALPAGPLRYHDAAHGFVCDDCGPASGPVLPEGGAGLPGRGLPAVARRPRDGPFPRRRAPWRLSTTTSSRATSSATCAPSAS